MLRKDSDLLARAVAAIIKAHRFMYCNKERTLDLASKHTGYPKEVLGPAYDALAGGTEPNLPPLPVRYRDFSAYQRDQVAAGAFEAELGYWQRQLASLPAGPMLPRRADVAASPGYRSGLRPLEIGPELAGAVRKLASSAGHTTSGSGKTGRRSSRGGTSLNAPGSRPAPS